MVQDQVLVVIGVGGMGQAIARRQGAGKAVLLADYNETTLKAAADALRGDGHTVTTHRVDVSSHDDVAELAQKAAAQGGVTQVAHTAGLSPTQASAEAILGVDLAGVAFVLEEFGRVVSPGGAGVVIASMAGHLAPPLTPEQEAALALTPADELLALPFASVTSPQLAYGIAKRANQLRVQAASGPWGERGARVNAISPGVISTPMGQQELASDHGHIMRAMIDASGTRRPGTPDDIAAATAFLLGPDSSFITGTDLLVDGGVVAALRSGRLDLAH
jgi:NAD(P)-dependent dehydrogenase (short-subunit alcohol dehydrogenase family)